MHLIIEAIGFGIATGAVIALGAVGFSVQFGISNILNITYGSLMTLAAYVGLVLISHGVNAWLALVLGALVVGAVSVIYHRVLLAPLVRRGTRAIAMVIVTVSAGIILQYVIVAIAGPESHSYGEQSGSTLHLIGFTLSAGQVAIIALTAVLMLALHLLLTRTTLGKAMRATSSNRTLARSCGIATDRVSDIAWLISGSLCGAAGRCPGHHHRELRLLAGLAVPHPDDRRRRPRRHRPAVRRHARRPHRGHLQRGGGGGEQPATTRTSSPSSILIAFLLVRPRGLFGAAWSSRRLMEG